MYIFEVWQRAVVSFDIFQFSIDNPIPFDIVKKIVKYSVKENLAKK